MNDPIVREYGLDSEYFATVRKLRIDYSCDVCKFHCGAEWEHVEGSRLPPEFRTLNDWKQEAKSKENDRKVELWKAKSRARFDAHLCHCAKCGSPFKSGQMVARCPRSC